jgi:phosphoglycolate phosphatase
MPVAPEGLRAVAFDLDGTLIDSVPDLAQAIRRMLREIDAPDLDEAQVRSLVGDGVESLVERSLLTANGTEPTAGEYTSALDCFKRLYAEKLYDRSRVYDGIPETLTRLRARGIALCCVTNKWSLFAVPLLAAAGLDAEFELVLCADDRERRKPRPDMLLDASVRLGIVPAQLAMVGDSRADVAAAQAAGCPVAAVTWGYGSGFGPVPPDWRIDSAFEIEAQLFPQREVPC